MEILIADEYRREELFHRLNSRLGLQIISLSALLYPGQEPSDTLHLFHCARVIRSRADQLKYYRLMLPFPAFYQELFAFARQLAEWGITADELPQRDESEAELKLLLSWILEEDLKEKKLHAALDERLQEIAAMENLQIIPGFEQDHFRWYLLQELQKRGIRVREETEYAPRGHLKHALSIRQEIEAVAQDICRHRKPCLVILASPSSQMPLVKQVFSRYGIPASFTCEAQYAMVPEAFFRAVDFMFHKDASRLLEVLASGLLIPCEGRLLSYLRQVLTEPQAPDVAVRYEEILKRIHSREGDTVAKNRELDIFRDLDEKAEEYFDQIDTPLQRMLAAEEPQEILNAAYDILSVSPLLQNENEYEAGLQIRSLLSEVMPSVKTEEDVLFIAGIIRSISISAVSPLSDICTVTDLHHPLSPRRITYVLGCSGRNYPGFKAMNGLFDEDYVREIDSFPSLAEREKAYLEQLSWIRRSAEEDIYYSYATNDYEGRQLIAAFELSHLDLQADSRWELKSAHGSRYAHHVLSPETAAALFTKEDEKGRYLRGSVSSIESWFSCPYRYFIASGLYVRKEQIPSVDAAHTGTIQHAVMENGMNMAGENYADLLTDEKIAEIIDPYFEALTLIEPHNRERIGISRLRMLKTLRRSVDFLREYEKCTMFRPYQAERHFDMFPISEHVRLNGTIDRINLDRANHLLEIMDYKSSAKNLTAAKVQEGLQLQLLSYMLTALSLEKEYEAGGAYYFSMKEENISDARKLGAAAVERRKFTVQERDFSAGSPLPQQLVRESRRLQGWTLTERTDAIDRDGDHVAGLKTVYDMAAVEDCLHVLYEFFYEKLLSGEESDAVPSGISLSPIEGACTFCDYAAICRFHGDMREPAKIYEKDLKKAKEAES